MKKYLCLIGVLGILLCNTGNSYAQKVAVKTNLLYDATTTMNLGLEIGCLLYTSPANKSIKLKVYAISVFSKYNICLLYTSIFIVKCFSEKVCNAFGRSIYFFFCNFLWYYCILKNRNK